MKFLIDIFNENAIELHVGHVIRNKNCKNSLWHFKIFAYDEYNIIFKKKVTRALEVAHPTYKYSESHYELIHK